MKVSTKVLEEAIKAVLAITNASEIQLVCKGEFAVEGLSEGRYARVIVDPKASGKWKTRCLAGVLSEVLKGSAEVDLSMKDESSLLVKYKNTEATVKTMPYEDTPSIDRKGGMSFSDKNQSEIVHALETVGITDVHEDGNSNFIFVKLTKEETIISRFDQYHMAYFSSKIKGKVKADLVIAVESLDAISRMAGKNAYTLAMDDSLRAWNDLFECQLPLIQADSQQSMETVRGLIESLKKGSSSFEVDREEFIKELSKSAAFHESGSSVSIEGKGKGISLNMKTSYGQYKSNLKAEVKGSVKFKLDPHLVMDTLRPIKDATVNIQLTDSLAFIKTKDEDRSAVYAFVLVS